jgi:hypothetical protein
MIVLALPTERRSRRKHPATGHLCQRFPLALGECRHRGLARRRVAVRRRDAPALILINFRLAPSASRLKCAFRKLVGPHLTN